MLGRRLIWLSLYLVGLMSEGKGPIAFWWRYHLTIAPHTLKNPLSQGIFYLGVWSKSVVLDNFFWLLSAIKFLQPRRYMRRFSSEPNIKTSLSRRNFQNFGIDIFTGFSSRKIFNLVKQQKIGRKEKKEKLTSEVAKT